MKKFIIPVIALLAVGCVTDTATESQNKVIKISIEELNAHRGDQCDCVNEKLEVIDAIHVIVPFELKFVSNRALPTILVVS